MRLSRTLVARFAWLANSAFPSLAACLAAMIHAKSVSATPKARTIMASVWGRRTGFMRFFSVRHDRIAPFFRFTSRVTDRPEVRRHLDGQPGANPRGGPSRGALRRRGAPARGRALGDGGGDQPAAGPPPGKPPGAHPAGARRQRLHRRTAVR